MDHKAHREQPVLKERWVLLDQWVILDKWGIQDHRENVAYLVPQEHKEAVLT